MENNILSDNKQKIKKPPLNKTKIITYSAMLSALGMVIVFFMPTFNIGITTVTPGSHVAVMIAMLIHPIVGIAVAVCTALAFVFKGVPPEVLFRAFSHLVFVIPGSFLAQKMFHTKKTDASLKTLTVRAGVLNGITAAIHAIAEVGSILLAFIILDVFANFRTVDVSAYALFVVIGLITLAHSLVDFSISFFIFLSLKKAHLTDLH